MILQSLYQLYQRLSANPENGLAPPGYSLQDITFRIVLTQDGTLQEILDERISIEKPLKSGKKKLSKKAASHMVLGEARKSEASFEPCFLWDDTRFVLGWHGKNPNSSRNRKCFENFKARHLEAENEIADEDFTTVCNFLRNWEPKQAENHPTLCDVKKGRAVFQISGKTKFVHDNEKIRDWYNSNHDLNKNGESIKCGQCLVSGDLNAPLSGLHLGIFGIFGSPYTGAKLVSFNKEAFTSFGKDKGFNSPVSDNAVFAYCSALNWLLKDSDRCFRIGDSYVVFWTAQSTPAEKVLPWMMSNNITSEDDATKQRLNNVLNKIFRGTLGSDDFGKPDIEYYILGLSLNQGRLSVRFWHTGSLGELITNLKLHLTQLEIVRGRDETNPNKPEPVHPSSYQLLRQTARDADGIPPLLGGALMRAILLGTRYPEALAHAVLRRIRVVEKKSKGEGTLDNVNYFRVAILKAWLLRNHHEWITQNNITMTTALDKENPSTAYQLGRLFAVYERAQRHAHEFNLDRTIRETMFSSASANPLSVFGRLDRLNKHHLRKVPPGSNRFYSDIIDEIHQKIQSPTFYPASLNPKEQSLFCIGYYHQRHALKYDKNKKKETETTTT